MINLTPIGRIELKLTCPAPFPSTVQVTRLVDAGGNVPAGITFPLAMTGPDTSGAFITAPLTIQPGTYAISYQSTLNGLTTAGTVTLAVGAGSNTAITTATIASAIAVNAMGPKQVTVDGQTTMQHSLPDQIAADRYNKSNEAAKRGGFPFKRVKFVRPGAAGYDRGAFPHFFDDPNWR